MFETQNDNFFLFSSTFAVQFIPLLSSNLSLTAQNLAPAGTNNNNNNFGTAALDQRDPDQMTQKNGTQIFNLVLCQGDTVFFIELSTSPYLVLQGGASSSDPVSLGYRNANTQYGKQLFLLNGPYIM